MPDNFYKDLPPESGGGGGIDSINGDTTSAQTIAAGTGVAVSSSGGTTTITNIAPTQAIAAGTGISVSTTSGTTTITNTETSTAPGGSNQDVQFNSSGTFAGSSSFTYQDSATIPFLSIGTSGNTGQSGYNINGNPVVFGGSNFLYTGCFASTVGVYHTFTGTGISFGTVNARVDVYWGTDGVFDFGVFNNGGLSYGRPRDIANMGAFAPGGYVIDSLGTTGGSFTIANHTSYYYLAPSALLATYTVTMPPNPIIGQVIGFGCPVNGATAFTLQANAGQVIYTPITQLLPGQTAAYQFVSNGNSWIKCR
jgi:hypothetical protein